MSKTVNLNTDYSKLKGKALIATTQLLLRATKFNLGQSHNCDAWKPVNKISNRIMLFNCTIIITTLALSYSVYATITGDVSWLIPVVLFFSIPVLNKVVEDDYKLLRPRAQKLQAQLKEKCRKKNII